MAGELLYFSIYALQQLGVILGVGAQTVLLCIHLVALHRGEAESSHGHFARAGRAALLSGLLLIVFSGLAAVGLHISTGALAVLLAPAFVFKWTLIAALCTTYYMHSKFFAQGNLFYGVTGGTWYALFLIHTLAPVTTWPSVLALYVAWMGTFALIWVGFVEVMRRHSPTVAGATIVVAKPQPKPIPVPVSAPKPVAHLPAPVHAIAPTPQKPVLPAPPALKPLPPPLAAPEPVVVAAPLAPKLLPSRVPLLLAAKPSLWKRLWSWLTRPAPLPDLPMPPVPPPSVALFPPPSMPAPPVVVATPVVSIPPPPALVVPLSPSATPPLSVARVPTPPPKPVALVPAPIVAPKPDAYTYIYEDNPEVPALRIMPQKPEDIARQVRSAVVKFNE